MAPHIMFMRGNIEIPDKDLLIVAFRETLLEIAAHIFQKVELMFKLIIHHRVGNIAARWDIEIMELKILVTGYDAR